MDVGFCEPRGMDGWLALILMALSTLLSWFDFRRAYDLIFDFKGVYLYHRDQCLRKWCSDGFFIKMIMAQAPCRLAQSLESTRFYMSKIELHQQTSKHRSAVEPHNSTDR